MILPNSALAFLLLEQDILFWYEIITIHIITLGSIFRFKLIDQGPEKSYGFERAQGGPPDEKAEDMMLELFDRACGRSLEDAAI